MNNFERDSKTALHLSQIPIFGPVHASFKICIPTFFLLDFFFSAKIKIITRIRITNPITSKQKITD